MEQEILVLATRNKNKIIEMESGLQGSGFHALSAYDFAELADVVEDLPTLEGNALKKARYTFDETGLPSLADDTGLEVDALDGRPGVFSARYAGENATYHDNVTKLIHELKEKQENGAIPPYRARFRTVLAFVTSNEYQVFHGLCEGQIIFDPAGPNGFGYDPIFVPEGYDITFAQMDAGLKNEISHRGKAMRLFRDYIHSA